MSRPPLRRLSDGNDAAELEREARTKYEFAVGRCVNDAEWGRTRSRLLNFAVILRGWDRKTKKPEAELGNVDAICRQGR